MYFSLFYGIYFVKKNTKQIKSKKMADIVIY